MKSMQIEDNQRNDVITAYTDATVIILPQTLVHGKGISHSPWNVQADMYSGEKLGTLGTTTQKLWNLNTQLCHKIDFIVCKDDCQLIIGARLI